MTNILLAVLLTSLLLSCADNNNKAYVDSSNYNNQEKTMDTDMDSLNVYNLTIDNTFLYGKYDNFITAFGLPGKLTIIKEDYIIRTKDQLDSLVTTAKNISSASVTLHYPGIDMWYSYNNSVIPFTIDFRKTDKNITYGKTTFDTTYTIEQFKKQFPKSANPSFTLPQSLFEITTKEKGSNFKHYTLIRKSKDDSDATPIVEFTFDNGKLIFILFANF